MKLSGWGNFPVIDADVKDIGSSDDVKRIFSRGVKFIPRGSGLSYGDASLQKLVLSSLRMDKFIEFDREKGIIKAQSGVRLSDILNLTVPYGWFLPVLPGTSRVTLGGAVSFDVHGKNGHREGSFCQHVEELEVILPSGEMKVVPKNSELFKAICGGMGLIAFILSVKLRLKRIYSDCIYQKVIGLRDFEELAYKFNEIEAEYTVGWFDFFHNRGLMFMGEHAVGNCYKSENKGLSIPFYMPNFVLNPGVISLYNLYYYYKNIYAENIVNYRKFFFPLDSLENWNRLYGRRGFVQYQFIVPSVETAVDITNEIIKAGHRPYLCVVKKLSGKPIGFMSFPCDGFTVALDFPVSKKLLDTLDSIDAEVVAVKGKIYLAKDSRMKRGILERMYPNVEGFVKIKERVDPKNLLMSRLWERVYYGK